MKIRKGKTYHRTCFHRLILNLVWRLEGRLLARAVRVDHMISQELSSLPDQFTCSIRVEPHGPSLLLSKGREAPLVTYSSSPIPGDTDLLLMIHDLGTAFRLASCSLTLSEAISRHAVSFRGDQGYGCTIIRIMDRMNLITLPRMLAKRTVKRYVRPEKSYRMRSRIWSKIVLPGREG